MNLFQSTDMVAITLTAMEWNQIIEALHAAPYGIAAPLINQIVQQGLRNQASMGTAEEAKSQNIPTPIGPRRAAKPATSAGPRLVPGDTSDANPPAAE